jgi:hypothetical protein
MDLVRELMLKLEAMDCDHNSVYIFEPGDSALAVDGYTDDEISYHLSLITEARWIESRGSKITNSFMFSRLSLAGHDFVDSVRSPEVWTKTKKGAEAAGGFTVDLLKDLAKGFIKKQIEEYTGVKL